MSFPNLSALAVRERAVTLFLILAVLAAGAFAFVKLGRAEDPRFTVKIMTVTAVWPGATAREMDENVGDVLEKRLQELQYYDRVETTAQPGVLQAKVILKDSTPPSAVPDQFYQVRKKLSDEARNLPNGVYGPFFDDEFSDVYFSLYAVQAKGLPNRDLVKRAEDLRQQLLQVPGVQKVKILGERPQAIYVDIPQARLATLGVTAQDIVNALRGRNDVTPSGSIETSGPRVQLRLDSGLTSLDDVRNVTLNVRGKLLKIGNFADVRKGYEDPATFEINHAGQPAVVLGVVMAPRYNGLTLGKALDSEEQTLRALLPQGLTITKFSDQAKAIHHSVDEFMMKFMMALGVVMLVSLVALGFRVGLVVAAAVPLTLSIVFIIMLLTGRDLDRVTLGALIISLGLLVDDAIIAIEMMVVKLEEGYDRIKAATFAWTTTAAPMLSGTLVTILGFIPVGFAQSSAGEYAGNIFWVVGFALITSWVVAVTFTPYLGVVMLPNIKPRHDHDSMYATKTYTRFRSLVRMAIDRRGITIGVTIGLFLLSGAGMVLVKKQFFPNSDRTELTVEIKMPVGSAFEATKGLTRLLEADLQKQPEAADVSAYIGQGAPRFFFSLNPELPNPAYAQVVIQTKDVEARGRLKARIRQWANDGRYPEARIRVTQFLFGPPVPYPVLFRVAGPEESGIMKIAEQVRGVMQQNPDVLDPHLDWGDKTPVMHYAIDDARMAQLNLTRQSVELQMQGLVSGVQATQIRDGTRTIGVVLRTPESDRRSPANLTGLTVTNTLGQAIPLSAVVHATFASEGQQIKRYDRDLFVAVQGDVRDGVQPPDATAKLLPKLAAIKANLPAGYRIDTGGSVEESAKANVALAAVVPVMILLTLVVLMIQVRAFSTMWMVFATAPLGLVGAVPTMLIFNQPFGFNAILALIGLSGILMRNTLILVQQINDNKAQGASDYDAVVEATVRRARPVILTAAAAMLAFIPLTHSVFWGALAFVLIGGVGVGTVLTLVFLPALYAFWFKVRKPQSEISNA
ncbi:Cobalt-zinc-cadmium resistance protein CzcA (plasmid) [Asticcacaulis sp. MM231]|uniref:efflux RND transporter permease subunit n=1 Tax=Asticcacaulis sp. MM231 TaxID=3157666 RepID=UPI0032D587EE